MSMLVIKSCIIFCSCVCVYEKMAGIFDDSQLEIIKVHKALSLRKKKHKSKKGKKGKGGSKAKKG